MNDRILINKKGNKFMINWSQEKDQYTRILSNDQNSWNNRESIGGIVKNVRRVKTTTNKIMQIVQIEIDRTYQLDNQWINRNIFTLKLLNHL